MPLGNPGNSHHGSRLSEQAAQLKAMHQQISDHEATFASLSAAAREMETEKGLLTERINEMEVTVDELMRERDDARSALSAHLDSPDRLAAGLPSGSEEEAAQLRTAAVSATSKAEAACADAEAAWAEAAAVKADAVAARAEAKGAQMKLEAAKESMNKLLAEHHEAHAQVCDLQAELAQAQVQIEELWAERHDAADAAAELVLVRHELEEAQGRVEELLAEREDSEREEEMDGLRAELCESQQQVRQAQGRVEELLAEQEEAEELTDERNAALNSRQDAQMDELKQALRAAGEQGASAGVRGRLTQIAEVSPASLQEQLTVTAEEVQTLELELSLLRTAIGGDGGWQRRVLDLKEELRAGEVAAAAVQAQMQRLEGAVAQSQAELEAAQSELASALKERDLLTAKLKACTQENGKVTAASNEGKNAMPSVQETMLREQEVKRQQEYSRNGWQEAERLTVQLAEQRNAEMQRLAAELSEATTRLHGDGNKEAEYKAQSKQQDKQHSLVVEGHQAEHQQVADQLHRDMAQLRADLESSRKDHQQEVQKLRKAVAELQTDAASLVAECEAKCEAQRAKAEALTAELASAKALHEVELDRLQREATRAVEALCVTGQEASGDSGRVVVSDVTCRLDDAPRHVTELQAAAAEVRSKSAEDKAELHEAVQTVEEESVRLQSLLAERDTTLDVLATELQDEQRQQQIAVADTFAVEAQLAQLAEALAACHLELDEQKAATAAAVEDAATCRRKLEHQDAAAADELAACKSALAQQQARIVALAVPLAKAEAEWEAVEADGCQVGHDIACLMETRPLEAPVGRWRSEVERLQKEHGEALGLLRLEGVSERASMLEELRTARQVHTEQVEALRAELEVARQGREGDVFERAALQKALDKMQQAHHEAVEEAAELQAALEAAQAARDTAVRQHADIQAARTDAQKSDNEFSADLARLRAALDAAQVARDAAVQEVEDLKQSLHARQEDLHACTATQQALLEVGIPTDSIVQCEAITELERPIRQLKNEVNELDQDVEVRGHGISAPELQVQQLHEEAASCADSSDRLHAELQELEEDSAAAMAVHKQQIAALAAGQAAAVSATPSVGTAAVLGPGEGEAGGHGASVASSDEKSASAEAVQEVADVRRKLKAAVKRGKAIAKERDALREQLATTTAANAASASADTSASDSRGAQLEQDLSALTAERDTLLEQAAAAERERQAAVQYATQAAAELEALAKERDAIATERAELAADASAAIAQVKAAHDAQSAMQDEIARLHEHARELRDEVARLVDELAGGTPGVEELRERLNELEREVLDGRMAEARLQGELQAEVEKGMAAKNALEEFAGRALEHEEAAAATAHSHRASVEQAVQTNSSATCAMAAGMQTTIDAQTGGQAATCHVVEAGPRAGDSATDGEQPPPKGGGVEELEAQVATLRKRLRAAVRKGKGLESELAALKAAAKAPDPAAAGGLCDRASATQDRMHHVASFCAGIEEGSFEGAPGAESIRNDRDRHDRVQELLAQRQAVVLERNKVCFMWPHLGYRGR
jgi:chromosome segregation ATPase